jgi:hypothetical protein
MATKVATVSPTPLAITGIKPPNGRAEIQAMFGNPANHDGSLNSAWEHANIEVAKPKGWKLFYQDDPGPVPTSGIRMHRLVVPNFNNAMSEIWAFAKLQVGGTPTDDAVRAWLHQNRLDLTGGGFNFRKITAGSGLSLHSYGIAIDWDPNHNPRKKPLTKTLPDWWFAIFLKWGFSNGCKFPTPDPMHIQFATGA